MQPLLWVEIPKRPGGYCDEECDEGADESRYDCGMDVLLDESDDKSNGLVTACQNQVSASFSSEHIPRQSTKE